MEDAFVQVLDIVVLTIAGERTHTVRPHEGDELFNEPDGGFTINYGEKEMTVGGTLRKLPGRKVTLTGDKLVEISRELRYEPRVRPSVRALASRNSAEVERVANQLGVSDAIKP